MQICLFFVMNLTYMTAVTFWYKDIDASGWDTIWIIPQYVWLLSMAFLASALCSAGVAILFYVLVHFWHCTPISRLQKIYFWALGMTATEIVRSTLFSAVTHHGSSPIEPMWGMYSVVQLTAHTPLTFLGKVVGVWGLVFLIFLLGAAVVETAHYALSNPPAKRTWRLIAATGCLLVITLALSVVVFGETHTYKLHIVAVHQKSSDNSYLKEIENAIKPDPKTSTIVVLPEYSNLFHPYANGTLPGAAYDARYSLPEVFKNTNVYFAGTEDDYSLNHRYVESYLATGDLNKTKRHVKTFLIPGGEYVMGWASQFIGLFDSDSVTNFSQTRGRTVINTPLVNDIEDPIADQIGIGACSTLLMPYHYRRQVSDGAILLTSNVSYEQFNRAPQYEKISHRFASLTAAITNRPFAIGDRAGSAVIYDNHGNLLQQSNEKLLIKETINQSTAKTLYVLLGDSLLFTLLALPFLYSVIAQLLKRKKSLRKKT